MARRPTVTRDKDNISSKLLGTNIADINVEKFREILQPPSYKVKGPLTLQLIKTITGKFSMDIIFTINLEGQGLVTVEALANCHELIVLNISKNILQSLEPLTKLHKLQILLVSFNKLNNFKGLANHQTLHTLNAISNSILAIDQLSDLKSCQSLRNLHLRSMNGDDANPICERIDYRTAIFQYLPQLKRLDFTKKDVAIEIKKLQNRKEVKLDIGKIDPFVSHIPDVPAQRIDLRKTPEEQKFMKESRNLANQMSSLQGKLRLLSL